MNTSNPAAQTAQPRTDRRSAASAVSAATSERSYDEWETVAVTALPPGWRNVYRDSEGQPIVSEAPALIVQEARTTVTVYESAGRDGRPLLTSSERPCQAPYETRAVVADLEGGYLIVASEASNYEVTVGPGEPVPEVAR